MTTTAQRAQQQNMLAGFRAAFNQIAATFNANGALLTAAITADPSQVLIDTVNAVNAVAVALNISGQKILAAVAAVNAIVVSDPPPIDPPPTSMPTWRQGLPLNVFTKIPGTAPAALPSSLLPEINDFKAEFDDYSGLGTDPETGLVGSIGGGGHASGGDYTCCAGLYLMENAPRWKMLKPAVGRWTTDAAGNIIANQAYFKDGTPTGAHNYYAVMPINVDGRRGMIRLLSAYSANGGGGPMRTDCFWFDTMQWDLNGAGWPAVPDMNPTEAAVCQNPATQRIFVSAAYGKNYAFDPIAREWSGWASDPSQFYGGGMVFVPDLNAIVADWGCTRPSYDTMSMGNVWSIVHDGGYGAIEHKTLKWITPKPPGFGKLSGMTYDPVNRKIYWMSSQAPASYTDMSVMRVNIDNWECEYLGAASIKPGTNWAAILNRMGYIPALKGIYYCPSYADEMHFMPTSA